MLRLLTPALLVGLAACAPTAQDSAPIAAFSAPALSAEALVGHVEVLASDEFEGRAPATRGEELTVDYLQRAFEAAGLQPGARGEDGAASWVQRVPLISSTVQDAPALTISGGDGAREYAFGPQQVVWSRRVVPQISVENAELVFVGYGVVAPEQNWNDYAGVDMRGKIAVMFINDPDFGTGADGGFGGQAMTYYGRWTYKYEEAARQGAAGAIIIHDTAGASYPWAVVESSNTGTQFNVVTEDGGMSRTAFEGWVTEDVGRELMQRAGLDLAEMRAQAQRQGFRPVSMGDLRGSVAFNIATEETSSNNVVAVLPGTERPDETILYTAHWDHLGRCTPIDGDDICNGALDNATGTAALIELARRFAEDGAGERSVAFIALTAEEQGLLGALYYSQNPLFEPGQTVAGINMDGINNMGRTRDIEVVGFGKSEMDDMIVAAAEAQGRRVAPDSNPEAGYFYRSDHLHLARIGIPVLYTSNGIDMLEGGEERGRALNEDYVANRYHKPTDELTPDWDMTGGAEDVALYYAIGRELADGERWPEWRPDAEFRAARVASRPSR
ncbi:MAG: M28 family metallopeptidase [Hyphomonadaceae bacterium]